MPITNQRGHLDKGFTLVELLGITVVLSIIAIIAGLILLGIVEDSRKIVFKMDVKSIEKEILSYATETESIGIFAIHNDRWCLIKEMQSNSEIISFDENTCVVSE